MSGRSALLFALLMMALSGVPTAHASVFLACAGSSEKAAPKSLKSRGLHTRIAEKKIEYLQKNRKVTAMIVDCLRTMENWQSGLTGACARFDHVLKSEILEKNFAFRMSQALSVRAEIADPVRAANVFDFDAQVDVTLSRASGLGVIAGQAALLPEEVHYVRQAFTAFWRNFTERYIAEFESKLATERFDKYRRRDIELRLHSLREALALTHENEMLERLSWTNDPGFQAIAQEEHRNFRRNHMRAWMSHLESMRIVAFLGTPNPSVTEMTAAFERFRDFGDQSLARLEKVKAELVAGRRSPSDDLVSDPMIVEEVLKLNPEYCAKAEDVWRRQSRRIVLRTVFIDLPLAAGLIATAFFAPPVVSLPLMAAADVYWISRTQIELRQTKDRFYATLTAKNQQASVEDVYEAEGSALITQMLAPLTLTMIHPSALKNLSALVKR